LSAQLREQRNRQQRQGQPWPRNCQPAVCRPRIHELCHVERSREISGSAVAISPPFTKRIASPSSNLLSDVVASYRANLIRSHRLKKSSSHDFSSVKNGDAFASAVRNSLEVCGVAGNPYSCVTYFCQLSEPRTLD